jgi:hypothetical protein
MPGNSYSHFGTFLWLAYPIFSLNCCLVGARHSRLRGAHARTRAH